MEIRITHLNGNVLLMKDGDTASAFVVNADRDDSSAAKLLAFLGVGHWSPDGLTTPAGTYEL